VATGHAGTPDLSILRNGRHAFAWSVRPDQAAGSAGLSRHRL